MARKDRAFLFICGSPRPENKKEARQGPQKWLHRFIQNSCRFFPTRGHFKAKDMKLCRFLLPALTSGLGLILAGRVTAQPFTNLHSFTALSGFHNNSDGAKRRLA